MPHPATATARRPGANGALDNHAHFLTQFAEQEARRRVDNRPVPLSAEEHAKNRQRLKRAFVKPVLAAESQINITGMLTKWKRRYCEEKKVGDPEATLKSLSRETTMDFFLYVCGNRTIKSWGTTHVYIRQFQQLYTTITGQFMDRNDAREVYKYHRQVLIPRFSLRPPNIHGKPVVSVAELRIILTFNIAYDTGVFPGERQRINLAGCYLIQCYTGARPAELVHNERPKPKLVEELFGSKVVLPPSAGQGEGQGEWDDSDEAAPNKQSLPVDELLSAETKGRGRPKALCYEDIQLMVVRHPVTGRATPAMAIKFVHHKGSDNRPKPTIFYFTPTKKLIFCPVSVIIALALHDHAFDAPSLTNASQVLGTSIWGSRECMPLRWKQSMLKIPVFRRFGPNGVLSDTEAMLYAKLRDDLGRQSLEAGFEVCWTPKFFRRGAANAANGNAPDVVRDQMMRHDPKFSTFHGAYLNERVKFDLQNTFLEEETEDQLYKLFAHVSITRDPRAKRDMVPDEVWANLPPDPEIVELEEQRTALKQGQYRIRGRKDEAKIRELTEKVKRRRAQRENMVVRDYREYYFYHRPTWDIARQALGEVEEEYEEPKVELDIPERARLAEIWCNQSDSWSDDEILHHRIEVIDLMVSLCNKRETRRRAHTRQRRQIESPIKQESPDPEPEPDPFPLLMDPSQCPDCIGDGRLSTEERTFKFCRPAIRNDHFDDQHLEARKLAQGRGDPIRCEHPKCVDVKLKTLDHFRNHVMTVHNIALRPADQAKTRRCKKTKHRKMARGQGQES
ncbi:hypothetical protein RB596_005954 [Gaeumannomyces avenae]